MPSIHGYYRGIRILFTCLRSSCTYLTNRWDLCEKEKVPVRESIRLKWHSSWRMTPLDPVAGALDHCITVCIFMWQLWILNMLKVSFWVTKPGQNFRNEVERRRGERERKEAERQGAIKGSANSNALCLLPTCPSTHLNLCYLSYGFFKFSLHSLDPTEKGYPGAFFKQGKMPFIQQSHTVKSGYLHSLISITASTSCFAIYYKPQCSHTSNLNTKNKYK